MRPGWPSPQFSTPRLSALIRRPDEPSPLWLRLPPNRRYRSPKSEVRRLPPRRRRLNVLDINNVGRIIARVAGRAIGDLVALTASLLETLQRKISQRIRANV